MRRLLLAALLLAWTSPALADRDAPVQVASMLQAITNDVPPSASGFTGPGDILAATDFWSFGCYKGTYTGTAFRLARDSDSSTLDVSCNNTTGHATVSTPSMATFCNATNCRLDKLYDQIGACDLTSHHTGTPSVENLVTLTGLNGQPSVTLSVTSADSLESSCSPSNTTPWSMYVVAKQTNVNANISLLLSDTSTHGLGYNSGAGNQVYFVVGANAMTASETDNSWHAVVGVANAASSAIYVDSTQTTGDGGSPQHVITNFCLGAQCGDGAHWFGGNWVEAYFLSGTAMTSTQAGNLTSNIRGSARWNF